MSFRAQGDAPGVKSVIYSHFYPLSRFRPRLMLLLGLTSTLQMAYIHWFFYLVRYLDVLHMYSFPLREQNMIWLNFQLLHPARLKLSGLLPICLKLPFKIQTTDSIYESKIKANQTSQFYPHFQKPLKNYNLYIYDRFWQPTLFQRIVNLFSNQ